MITISRMRPAPSYVETGKQGPEGYEPDGHHRGVLVAVAGHGDVWIDERGGALTYDSVAGCWLVSACTLTADEHAEVLRTVAARLDEGRIPVLRHGQSLGPCDGVCACCSRCAADIRPYVERWEQARRVPHPGPRPTAKGCGQLVDGPDTWPLELVAPPGSTLRRLADGVSAVEVQRGRLVVCGPAEVVS